MIKKNRLAGIQYIGLAGISEPCVQAIQRLLQYNDRITSARILTCRNHHSLLLTIDEDEKIGVKSGFTSGYNGEGPRAFAKVIQLLQSHGTEIEEVEVEQAVMDRLNASSLTTRDIKAIEDPIFVRPTRIYSYIHDCLGSANSLGMNWNNFPAVIPFAIIDRRIADLALRFIEEPNDTLLQGFRRLEDTVRKRTESEEHGAKLFSQAFQGEGAKLTWRDTQSSEVVGRVNLFTGAYMAHRNPRAHREMHEDISTLLSEFLLLNHLFQLEAQAIPSTINT